MTQDSSPDVVVVGGGIMGAAAGYEMARQGLRVTLLDRREVASEQSGRNWGFVRQQGRSPAELPLMMAANARWQQLPDELDASIGWIQGGNLALADTEDAKRRYLDWLAVARQHGLPSHRADSAEVQRLVPGLRLPYCEAIYLPTDGGADPVPATRAYVRAAQRAGARVVTQSAVHSLLVSSGRVTGVVTDQGTVRCDRVVCSAGASTRSLLRTAGLRLPQSPVRETVCLTNPLPPVAKTTVWANGLAFRQRADSRVVLSDGAEGDVDLTPDMLRQARFFAPALRNNWRHFRPHIGRTAVRDPLRRPAGDRTYEPAVNRSRVARSVANFMQALPEVGPVTVERQWAGIIDSTPDALPVIDRLDDPAGLVVATGFSGHGFGLGPAVGQIVADLVQGRRSEFDLTPFRYGRFWDSPLGPPESIL